jgi:hypothetical protein
MYRKREPGMSRPVFASVLSDCWMVISYRIIAVEPVEMMAAVAP